MAGVDLTEARRIAGLIRRDVPDRSQREEALVALDDEVERLREREAALIRVKDADLDDLRDAIDGRDRLVTDIAQVAAAAEREHDQARANLAAANATIERVRDLVDPIQVRDDLKTGWNMLRAQVRAALDGQVQG